MTDTSIDSQTYWDRHAAADPLWTVLSLPDKSGGRWSLAEFMKTGEREIALLFHRFEELRLSLPNRRGLDFGCGVGRLTQALARRMQHVTGVDISPVMIEHAQRLNQYPDRVNYICSAHTGLETLEARSFQCIYTNIVLQHVAPDLSVRYLHEFFRLLEPEGLLVFQLPSHKEQQAQAEITAMPEHAYGASITLAGPAPATAAASSEIAMTFTVRNTSNCEWSQPKFGPLALGNHWLDGAGELMLLQDDGRAPLLQIVPPGMEWPVLVTMHAPSEPGRYTCEIDLVHEGISWYGHKGSRTLRFTVDVTPSAGGESRPAAMMQEYQVPEYSDTGLPQATSAEVKAEFPMNGVPREQVLEIIKQHGGRLAYLEEDRRAGPEWVSYRYFVVGPLA